MSASRRWGRSEQGQESMEERKSIVLVGGCPAVIIHPDIVGSESERTGRLRGHLVGLGAHDLQLSYLSH